MSISTLMVRDGELPPGTVDGYCTTCAGDTIVAAPDYTCRACGNPVHVDSLPRDARLAMMRGDAQPEPVRTLPARNGAAAAPAAVKTFVLPTSREALAWDRATDQLVAAAEADEAKAKAEYDRAKARYQEFRQATHLIRQLRQLARVDGAAETSTPVVQARRSAPGLGGRWAMKHDACINCGTTERKHAQHGRCTACAAYMRDKGRERPIRSEAQTNG